MYPNQEISFSDERDESSYDDLMADLFTLITHHSLTQCEHALPNILGYIRSLTHHSDIECYPKQLRVLLKMETLWRTQLFRSQISQHKH